MYVIIPIFTYEYLYYYTYIDIYIKVAYATYVITFKKLNIVKGKIVVPYCISKSKFPPHRISLYTLLFMYHYWISASIKHFMSSACPIFPYP